MYCRGSICTECLPGHRLIHNYDDKIYCKKERTPCRPDKTMQFDTPNIEKMGRGNFPSFIHFVIFVNFEDLNFALLFRLQHIALQSTAKRGQRIFYKISNF